MPLSWRLFQIGLDCIGRADVRADLRAAAVAQVPHMTEDSRNDWLDKMRELL